LFFRHYLWFEWRYKFSLRILGPDICHDSKGMGVRLLKLGLLIVVAGLGGLNAAWSAESEPDRSGAGCKTAEDVDRAFLTMWHWRSIQSQSSFINCVDVSNDYNENKAPAISATYAFEVFPLLTSSMQFNLENFITEMERRPVLFRRWLSGIEPTSWTWDGDPPCALQHQIDSIRALFAQAKSKLGMYPTYNALVAKFAGAKCRQID
jgi:hypothetical protein